MARRSLPLALLCILCEPPPAGPQRQPQGEAAMATATVKSEVDLVLTDVLVAHRKNGRSIDKLRKSDFVLYEEGVAQEITHFSHDALPVSLLLLVDRGGCLDPFRSDVREAARVALQGLKSDDEVALMSFAGTTELVQRFTRERSVLPDAIERVPEAREGQPHCYNRAFCEAARYIREAANPQGRRAIVLITGSTTNFDCSFPSAAVARDAVLESGAVVCGLIPRGAVQRLESSVLRFAGGVSKLVKVPVLDLKALADETGGEILSDRPDRLHRTFGAVVERLRKRYTLGFVSSNRTRDGGYRRLKVELSPEVEKRERKPAVKSRRGYVAPAGSGRDPS